VDGNHSEIETLVQRAIDNQATRTPLSMKRLTGAMEIVGKRFAANEIFVRKCFVSASP